MNFFKKTIIFMSTLLLLSGCQSAEPAEVSNDVKPSDILTLTPVDKNKTMITARYESGIPHQELENIIEEQFPDIDIVMKHGGSNNSAYSMQKNLELGQEQDIIFSVDIPAVNNASTYFADLSSQKFSGQYYVSSIEPCIDKNGAIYYLPGLSDIYGIVYDRTMFEENGWEIPHSYSEFISLVETINNSGLTVDDGENIYPVEAVDLSLKFADAFQIVFNTFGYEKVYKGATNQKWLQEYRLGENSMKGHMESAAEIFIELADAGVIDSGDFDRRPWERSNAIYKYHTTAMIFENMNFEKNNIEFQTDETIKHEVGIFPFYISDKPDSDFVYSIPSYYMAINKNSADKDNGKILFDIFDFLSQPDTQKKLIGDSIKLSPVEGVAIEFTDLSENIAKTLESGRIINNFSLVSGDNKRTVEIVMRNNAAALIEKTISVDDWLGLADTARDNFLNNKDNKTSYGISVDNFSHLETVQLVGNMYRELTEAEIALVFVGSDNDGVTGKIYKGDITDDTFSCISPSRRAYTDPAGIAWAMMTGRQIMDILNGYDGNSKYNYTIASGLDVVFAPWNTPGKRLISCKLPDGQELDPEKEYKVAYYTGSLRTENNKTLEVVPGETILSGSWEENFKMWIGKKGGAIKAPELTTTIVWEEK